MNKKILFIVLIMMVTLLISGCRNPIDIFKTYVFGEPEQEDNPLSEGDNIPIEDLEDEEEIGIPDENTNLVTLYYRDSGDYIVPVVRKMPKVEGVATAALTALIDSPENRNDLNSIGLQPVLPTNTQVELALKEDGLMRVNLSGEVLKVESKEEEESMVSSLVYTLTEFETVNNVQIMVNNEIIETLTYGTDVSKPISRGNINALNNPVEGEQSKLTLYMYNNTNGYTYFVPMTKNVPANSRNIETAVKELVSSKGDVADLQLNIPEGTNVFGVNIESGIAYVSFSEQLTEMTDAKEISNLTKAIGLTLKEFEGIQGVKLVIDGNEKLSSETVTIPTFANSY